jgi:hypothetical protein
MDDQVQEPQEQQQEQVATAEQQEQQPQEQQQEQKPAPADWALRRIAEITAKRREAEAEAARWKEQYERAQSMVPADQQQQHMQANPQSVDQLARAYAENMRAQEREQERLVSIEKAGRKEFGADFDAAVSNLNAAGVGGPEFLRVIAEIPNAEKVVAWLGKHDNLGEAVRIAGLSPIQMGIEMTKLSTKAAKEMTKQISKAPAPIQAIEGGSSASDSVEPAVGSKEWFKWRNESARKRR